MSTRDKTKRDTAAASVDPLLSMQVGEFVIQERIGAGGMGVVYRATHPLIGKQVAIKVLRPELVSETQVERLLIEARSVNAIQHPGIIDIFGFGSLPDGRPYITMELLQGYTLAQFLQQRGRLDAATTVWILDQMLSALGAAHRAGVVHRDLKPGNVFLAEAMDGKRSVKLVDFGIAKLLESRDGPTTVDGSILGTPEYMAPEQVRGKPVGPATDLYAVGIIAFQMLTGSRPFQGEPLQVLFAHVEQQPPLPSSTVPGLPPELDTLVLHLLAKDPALRPESAEAVRRALSRVPGAPAPQLAVSAPEPVTLAAPLTVPPTAAPSTVSTTTLGKLEVTNQGRGRKLAVASLAVAGLGVGAMLLSVLMSPGAPAPREVTGPQPEAPAPVAPPTQAPMAEAAPPPAPPEQAPQQPTEEEPPPAGHEQELADAQPTAPEELPVGAEQPAKVTKPSRSTGSKPRHRPGTGGKPGATLASAEGDGVEVPELEEEPPAEVAPPPQRRESFLPSQGRTPSDAKLSRRLVQLETLYLGRTMGRAPFPELEQDLVRLHGLAVKAETATERMEVQRALDVWRERLEQRLRGGTGDLAEAMGRAAAPSQASASPLPSGKAGERVLQLRQSLLTELQQAEQELRARVGDGVNGSPALANLEKLRTRAQTATTSKERTTLRNELAAWKRQYLAQATEATP